MAFGGSIGIGAMILVMSGITAVLTPLSAALDLGNKSINGMAEGVVKLSDALAKLDFEKLNKLKEVSAGLASASGNNSAIQAMAKMAEAMNNSSSGKGGSSSGGDGKPLVVQLVLPNGRVLQEQIIKGMKVVGG
jgi:hypothetical protein